MTTKDIVHLRLLNQSIALPHLTDPYEVVRSLGAVQAQDYGQALWAIGLRTRGAKLGGVLGAIEAGKILRTWPMRGTIHFVPAEDAKWMVRLSGERTISSSRSRLVGLGLDDKVFRVAEEILRSTLEGGRRLTRPTIMKLLEDNGIATGQQRGLHILGVLSLRGVLCIGPMEGKQLTYALLNEWAPDARELSHEESLGELARRYFTSHGPATIVDFATWSGQPLRNAKIGLELAKSELISKMIDGVEYWMRQDLPPIPHKAVAGTYLLAGFEEYLLGYKDRSAVVTAGSAPASVNGIFFPIIVADGKVMGLWKRVITPKSITISLRPFQSLPLEVLRDVRHKAEAYGEFMGLPIALAQE